ncbi:MAG: hypothetical protein ABR549_14365 [Mycobacteriales bacterium]
MRRLALAGLLLVVACQPKEPTSQRIAYDVESPAGRTTTTVLVEPGHRARTTSGSTSTYWSESGVYGDVNGRLVQTAVIAPGFPGPEAHLDLALPEALRQRLVRDLGTSQSVAGVSCHEWESAKPLDGAPFAPATAQDRTVSCVSADGRLLADRWTIGGTVAQARTATAVGTGPSLRGDRLFEGRTPIPLPAEQSPYSVTASDAAALVAPLGIPVPVAPAGLTLESSVALLERTDTGPRREDAVLVYRGSSRMLVLRIGRDLTPGTRVTPHGAGVTVGRHPGYLAPVLPGLQLTVTGPRGLRATITADLDRDDLLDWAATLRLE